jgi:hypothetical protein
MFGRILDVTSFAVNAVLRVDDEAGRAFLHPFVYAGRAVPRRAPINIVLGGLLQAGISDEMHR